VISAPDLVHEFKYAAKNIDEMTMKVDPKIIAVS
jgi:hypothetical protein